MEGSFPRIIMLKGAASLTGLAAFLLPFAITARAENWVHAIARHGDLPLASGQRIAPVVTDPADHAVVAIAAQNLRDDLVRVTGGKTGGDTQIWIGTLGRNAAIDRLVADRRIAIGNLKGAWESFLITSVDKPRPGVARALVIVGSDRRGTAYGAYELSRAIGVSPWHWWADVNPAHRASIHVAKGLRRFGPPSVRYRGIFLNDEDWGLVPWAAATHAPNEKPLGPKSYARLFELLLRLKANLIWPAMHKLTQPFNADPANAALADRYAIVMGSSHAEPMLRNNVGEWTAPPDAFNYVSNAPGVQRYWEERVASHARYESIWTLGMRGIHDSGMVGPATLDERRATLDRIIADQRAMLDRANIAKAPQVFTPYKEVLDLYRAGLKIPDDVTLMWPDDNFGYIRHFPDTTERARAGGSGVYYHLSYLGAPLSYLWLSTTPPALIREEMGRAYDRGARQIWVANVGDLKPAELATDYFLSLAWDIDTIRAQGIDSFVEGWAAENIGAAQARPIAGILRDYHRLNFDRRPEHLQYYLPGEKARPSPLSMAQADARLADFTAMTAAAAALEPAIPADRRDAFFELVTYPVAASAAANHRFFAAEAHDRLRDTDLAQALQRGAAAHDADDRLRTLTHHYNHSIAGGKWRSMMAVEPADGQWRSYRLIPPLLPAPDAPVRSATPPAIAPPPSAPLLTPRDFIAGSGWRHGDGLGRHGNILSPTGQPGTVSATIMLPAGDWRAIVDILPTYADTDGDPLRLTLAIDGIAYPLSAPRQTGDRAWAQAVLDNRIALALPARLASGTHRLTLRAADPGVLVEAIRFAPATDKDGLHLISHGVIRIHYMVFNSVPALKTAARPRQRTEAR